ncbi:DUF2141 domain-containing protein [Pelomonas sp. V22]|uniref:DUF2141 domain-containing protein n=1 Tax=Pelomonas sp. V22 TaxID=2822139 RepID=UPI0024A92677|nr:DUF2141 domain-containing protein [Pelomonas sp. V22]MDI4631791.1 DUF2141 domain-containing protein [Pelomonas sp. V22]
MNQAIKTGVRLALLAAAMTAGLAQAAEIELEVTGLKQAEGQLMVAAFVDVGNWLRKPVAVATVAASKQEGGRIVVRIKDLPESGDLALSVLHDVNGNGKMDSNPMGMPLEPFAFSNNAVGNFGPASFEQAKFTVKPGARISVRLN